MIAIDGDNKRFAVWAASILVAFGGLSGGIQLISDHMTSAAWPFLLLGIAGLLMLFRTWYRRFSQSREHRRRWQSRTHQSDEEFLCGCGFSPGFVNATVALAVRRALEETAGIPACTIYANDSMKDSIWESIDLLDIWFRTEKAAGVRIGRNWFDLACKHAGSDRMKFFLEGSNVLVRHLVTAIVESASAPF